MRQQHFDSSALLAFLAGEPGADRVEDALESGGRCSVVNWSEVAQKVLGAGRDWPTARALLLDFDLQLEPVGVVDAERAAELWSQARHLSIADRLCLATGERLDADVWTADRAWGDQGRIVQIRGRDYDSP